MSEIREIKLLREELKKCSNREELDSSFKKWREKCIVPLRLRLKSLNEIEEKKRLGREVNNLIKLSQEVYYSRKRELSGWLSRYFKIRECESCIDQEIHYRHCNPLSELLDRIYEFILNYGFKFMEKSEIVSVSDNFDSLLIPEGHPSREESDSFFLDSVDKDDQEPSGCEYILRTHTTSTTLQLLAEYEGRSFKGSTIGSVYRKEDNDVTHLSQFTQLDLIWVEKELSFGELEELIKSLLFSLFTGLKNKFNYRFRPSFFPFTSPSYEVDLSCICGSNPDCKLCGGIGWVEILGCGFMHQDILSRTHAGFSGIAMGLGIERLCMIKYSIPDIRCIHRNEFKRIQRGR